jgi:hypothetical protein
MVERQARRVIPNAGRGAREEAIWDSWREVIRRGLPAVKARSIEPLAEVLGPLSRPVDQLQRRLLAIVADSDAAMSVAEVRASWAEFEPGVQARLELVRAGALASHDLAVARERASAALAESEGTEPEKVETFRKEENGEYRILCELLEITRRRCRDQIGASPEAQGAGRSGGRAARKASAAAVVQSETGRFWARASTLGPLSAISKEKCLTVYLGTDGDFDVASISRRRLYSRAIGRRLSETNGPAEAEALALDHLAPQLPSSQLGSILRQLYSGERGYRSASEAVLRSELGGCIDERMRDGPLARALTYLMFAGCDAGRDVELMSASLGPELERAARDRRDRYPAMEDIDYVRDGEVSRFTRKVRLIEMQGREEDSWSQSLAIGELDFEADPALGRRDGPSRSELLVHALASRPVLFVGTDLSDPGLLSALARTADAPESRYALVLPPAFRASLGLPPQVRAARRRLLTERYLHLGVVPVIADFPYEISQALREIAVEIERGRDHQAYEDRFRRWTDLLPEHSGITMKDDRLSVDPDTRVEWKEALSRVVAKVSGRRRPAGLDAEMWLWNDHSESLHRVSSTDGRRTRPVVSLFDDPKPAAPGSSGSLAIEALRRGHSVEAALTERPSRFGIAINIVQYGGGERLPVGVLTILAGAQAERLQGLAVDRVRRGDLENELAEGVRALLPTL